jgi:hypothetical protein
MKLEEWCSVTPVVGHIVLAWPGNPGGACSVTTEVNPDAARWRSLQLIFKLDLIPLFISLWHGALPSICPLPRRVAPCGAPSTPLPVLHGVRLPLPGPCCVVVCIHSDFVLDLFGVDGDQDRQANAAVMRQGLAILGLLYGLCEVRACGDTHHHLRRQLRREVAIEGDEAVVAGDGEEVAPPPLVHESRASLDWWYTPVRM